MSEWERCCLDELDDCLDDFSLGYSLSGEATSSYEGGGARLSAFAGGGEGTAPRVVLETPLEGGGGGSLW